MIEHQPMTEADILWLYSTPGLRKGEMTREAKRDHLTGLKVDRNERDKIISALYGHTDADLFVTEHKVEPRQRWAPVTVVEGFAKIGSAIEVR